MTVKVTYGEAALLSIISRLYAKTNEKKPSHFKYDSFIHTRVYIYIVIYTLNQKEQSEQGDLGRRPVHFNGQLCQGKGPPSPLCSRYNHQSKGGKIIL